MGVVMTFQMIDKVWRCNDVYRGNKFNISVVKPRPTSTIYVANVHINDKRVRLGVMQDIDFSNVCKDAVELVKRFIDSKI